MLGTLGTAFLTYIATRRQALDQGKVDHWQRVHEERRGAYLALLEDAATVTDVAHSFTPRAMPDDPTVSGSIAELNRAVPKLHACAARIALAGSVDVSAKAFEVYRTARNWRLFLELLVRNQLAGEEYGDRLRHVTLRFTEALGDFTVAARAVLQVPPSQLP